VCTSPQVDCTTDLLNQITGKGLGRRRKRKRRGFFVDFSEEFGIFSILETGHVAFASFKSVCPYVTGPNCCLNETRMPLYYLYSFQSTSMQNIAQLAQSWYLLPFFSPNFLSFQSCCSPSIR
jgi:hypothetical protein